MASAACNLLNFGERVNFRAFIMPLPSVVVSVIFGVTPYVQFN